MKENSDMTQRQVLAGGKRGGFRISGVHYAELALLAEQDGRSLNGQLDWLIKVEYARRHPEDLVREQKFWDNGK